MLGPVCHLSLSRTTSLSLRSHYVVRVLRLRLRPTSPPEAMWCTSTVRPSRSGPTLRRDGRACLTRGADRGSVKSMEGWLGVLGCWVEGRGTGKGWTIIKWLHLAGLDDRKVNSVLSETLREWIQAGGKMRLENKHLIENPFGTGIMTAITIQLPQDYNNYSRSFRRTSRYKEKCWGSK